MLSPPTDDPEQIKTSWVRNVKQSYKVDFFWLDSHTSSEYSDWTADAGINLQPSTPVSSRKRVQRRLSTSEEEEEENEEEEEKQQSDEEEKPGKSSKEKAKKAKNKSPRVSG